MPADIIAFPARRASRPRSVPNAGTKPAEDGKDRLRRALERLNAANNRQREAVAGWRQALSDLQSSMQALNGRLGAYRSQLDQLQDDLGGLRGEAQRLERWASDAERQGRTDEPAKGSATTPG